MLFNSLTFVVFFAVVVTAYWSMTFVDHTEKHARRRELYFLRRLESSLRRPPLFHHGDGFLARLKNCQSQTGPYPQDVARRQRDHEFEHARIL